MTMTSEAPRRTQRERRESSIRKLLDATCESLIEVGYANTSIQQICSRAGLSHGGLFRHFSSRLALIIAVADEVNNALIDQFAQRFQALREQQDPFRLALSLLRDNCRARDNEAWFELIMAARTDAALREAMQPIWQENRRRTLDIAQRLFPLEYADHPDFPVLVDCIVSQFHGEAINAFVEQDASADQARLECTLTLVDRYLNKG